MESFLGVDRRAWEVPFWRRSSGALFSDKPSSVDKTPRGPILGALSIALLVALFVIPSQLLPGKPLSTLIDDRGWRLFFTFFWMPFDLIVVWTLLYLGRARTRSLWMT